MLEYGISKEFIAEGLLTEYRLQSVQCWDDTLVKLPFVPIAYTRPELDYQIEYQKGVGVECVDASVILFHDGRPCGVWPLTAVTKDGVRYFSNYLNRDSVVFPPLFVVGLADVTKKAIAKKCLRVLANIGKRWGVGSWKCIESFVGHESLSEWYEQSLLAGASVSLRHELHVDLSLSIGSIKSKFRRSYKSLVTEGMRLWKVDVLATADHDLWESFRNLHQRVAGRGHPYCANMEHAVSGNSGRPCVSGSFARCCWNHCGRRVFCM